MIKVSLPAEPVNQHEISCWVVDVGYLVPKISRHRMIYQGGPDDCWFHFWNGPQQGRTDGWLRPLGMDWSKSYPTEDEAKRAALAIMRERMVRLQDEVEKVGAAIISLAIATEPPRCP